VESDPASPTKDVRRGHILFRAPRPPVTIGLVVVASAALSLLLFGTGLRAFLTGWLLVFAAPALLAAVLTGPLAAAAGGRLEFHRSAFLALGVLLLQLPIAAVWRLGEAVVPAQTPGVAFLAAFLVGPAVWFRHLTLYGVARPSHARMMPATLLMPVLFLLALLLLVPATLVWLVAALACALIGFGCAVALLRAADRPLRREFQISGVRLIRPLLDHVSSRDPAATAALEGFFLRFAQPADLRVSLLTFSRQGRTVATVALPTVHPGPFAALGASDLPRKLEEQLGPSAGVVFVPHTPSDHDLDLPSQAEVDRVGAVARSLATTLGNPVESRAGPLVSPAPGSFARAQLLGDVALVVVSQAPDPTDDIAFSVADRIVREVALQGGPRVALLDAHNSYVEGKGDISYGTPAAEKLVADAQAAVRAATAAAGPGPIEVGLSVRSGFEIGRDGIGPHGIRAFVIRACGTTSAYVLVDGNNLLLGRRAPIVAALERLVDHAEVLTTDNHVVHEVDGSINPVGERLSEPALIQAASDVVRAAVADLAPAEVRFGSRDIPAVPVLGPAFTARLLTSLGDTLAMFTNMAFATLLLLLTGSLVVVFALQ
jgi:predicted neutral ceramidase superfamily lipid hydrolase